MGLETAYGRTMITHQCRASQGLRMHLSPLSVPRGDPRSDAHIKVVIGAPKNDSQGILESSPANLPTINLTGHNQLIFPSKRELESPMPKNSKECM